MMAAVTAKTKRPSSITFISVAAMLLGLNLFYFILSPGIQKFVQAHDVWESLFLGFSGLGALLSGVGFWLMKKWAVYTFMAFAVISQIQLIAAGRWTVLSVLLLAVPVFVGYKHFSKMT